MDSVQVRGNLVQESARHLEMTRGRQMSVDTGDLAEAQLCQQRRPPLHCPSVQPCQHIFISSSTSAPASKMIYVEKAKLLMHHDPY